MQSNYLAHCLLLIGLVATPTVASASEVTVQHRSVTLNAELELAAGRTLADGVVLITHGALAHRDMESITYLRTLLGERGYNTLAINLSLGLDNRHGMYDCATTHRHRNDDAVDEIGVWVNWLNEQGSADVILLGHSRGGSQTALYAAERHSDLLKAVVLMAPATGDNNSADAYRNRYGQALEPLLEKARTLAGSGNSDAILEHVGLLTCGDTTATATALISYYGQDPRLDTPYLIPKIEAPTLIVVAGGDSVVVDLDRKVEPLADGRKVQMAVVDGADHMFRDLYADDAVETIDAFLQALRSQTPSD